jgi:hypothetical protein
MTNRQILRLIFHKDTIALIASIVFLWFTISLIADTKIEKQDLSPHIGKLIKIDSVITKVIDKPFFKEITKELRLTLDTESDYFTSITTENFGYMTSQINLGDTIAIFTKPKLWGLFGMKRTRDISHLTKGNQIVIDFPTYQKSISGLFILTLIATVVFFIIYYLRTIKRYTFDISGNP